VLALTVNRVVLGVLLVLFVGPWRDHVLELGDRTRAAATEVFEGATVVESVLEEVDDLLVGDVDYGRALVGDLVLQLNGIVLVVLLFLATWYDSCLARALVCLTCVAAFGVSSIGVQNPNLGCEAWNLLLCWDT
jgi:hypothetical protein